MRITFIIDRSEIFNKRFGSSQNWSWWHHQMETFSALLAICAGNSPVTGEFPAQRPVTRALMFSLISAGMNDWVNKQEAGDLRRHCAHYDVTVMFSRWLLSWHQVNTMSSVGLRSARSLQEQMQCILRINTLRPGQNGRQFADDVLNCVFMN